MQSLRKNLWDAEDRLRAVDLNPEADSDKPLIAVYTYDAGGERTIKYVPARIDARYSAKEAGSADRLEAMIYPNALLTAKILPIPEEGFKGNRQILKYTKHYYIGSERIASYLGTRQSVGMYCDQETTLIDPLDAKVLEAGQALEDVFTHFNKTIDFDTPYLYGNSRNFVCGPTQLTQHFGAYWYHPDHLGSSSYITNLAGEISQHMEYLPFGETLIEEHLNSNNSPYKFNAKEFDAETGNYYYGARYYSPKYNLMLSVDPALAMYPGISPYAYTLQNPVRYVDPTGMFVEDYDDIIIKGKNGNEITILTAGDDRTFNVPYDIEESKTVDLGFSEVNSNNLAVGYSVNVSAEVSATLGGKVSGGFTVVNYFNEDFGDYNYVYAQTEYSGSTGVQAGYGASIEANFFVMTNPNAYGTDTGDPASFAGPATSFGYGLDLKAMAGAGLEVFGFQSGNWKGVGVGLNVGVGDFANLGAAFKGWSNSIMLSNQKLTSERSFGDRFINSTRGTSMMLQAAFQYFNK